MSQLSLELSGKVVFVGETIENNGFEKRKLWLEIEDDRYDQTVEIEFIKDKCSLLDSIKVGSIATIDINLRGKVFTSKKGDEMCFTTLNGWRIKANAQTNASSGKSAAPKADSAPKASAPENDDDLPF